MTGPATGPFRVGLVTPGDWYRIAIAESFDLIGTPEGRAKLAEAKRYEACAQRITTLQNQVASLTRALLACQQKDAP